jgi:hypothetical protein
MGIFSNSTELFNASILRIGGRSIASLSDGTREAQYLATYWKLAAFETVKDHQWNDLVVTKGVAGVTPQAFTALTGRSADKWIDLAGVTTSPASGLIGIYGLTDKPCAHIKDIIVEGVQGSFNYKQEGTKIVSSGWPSGTPGISVVYYAVPTTAGTLDVSAINDSLFLEALILKLAQKIVYGLSQNMNAEQKLMAEYQACVYQARRRDGVELTGEESPTVSQLWNASMAGAGGQQQ